jgi:hypothetical protein
VEVDSENSSSKDIIYKKEKVSEYIVDETILKVGSEFI